MNGYQLQQFFTLKTTPEMFKHFVLTYLDQNIAYFLLHIFEMLMLFFFNLKCLKMLKIKTFNFRLNKTFCFKPKFHTVPEICGLVGWTTCFFWRNGDLGGNCKGTRSTMSPPTDHSAGVESALSNYSGLVIIKTWTSKDIIIYCILLNGWKQNNPILVNYIFSLHFAWQSDASFMNLSIYQRGRFQNCFSNLTIFFPLF